jgi:hypothetical protein
MYFSSVRFCTIKILGLFVVEKIYMWNITILRFEGLVFYWSVKVGATVQLKKILFILIIYFDKLEKFHSEMKNSYR